MDYNFEVCYRPGRQNSDADALSRQAWEEDEAEEQSRATEVLVGGDVGMSPTEEETVEQRNLLC